MNPEPWARRYVGIPHVTAGRSFEGADCWGVCDLPLRHEAGLSLPDWDDYDQADVDAEHPIEAEILRVRGLGGWKIITNEPDEVVAAARPFDVVLFRQRGVLNHMGIVCGLDQILSSRPPIANGRVRAGRGMSTIDRLSRWRLRTEGLYRHVDLR